MQKLILIAVIGFSFLNSAFSQTTLEEYNYLTKGYKIQIESGLDMKKGYRFEDLHDNSVISNSEKGPIKRTMHFKGLYREGENIPCAVLIIYNRLDNKFRDYICIPHWESSKEIWNMCFDKIKGYEKGGAEALMWGLSKSSSFFAKE